MLEKAYNHKIFWLVKVISKNALYCHGNSKFLNYLCQVANLLLSGYIKQNLKTKILIIDFWYCANGW
jgi:hypothetical protein